MDPDTARWLETATTANQLYLLPLEGPLRITSSFPQCRTDDVIDDVRTCQGLVERAGMEMLSSSISRL